MIVCTQAQPFFKDPKRFPDMADPILERKFPVKSLNQAIGVAAMCVQEEPSVRPLISDVVAALSFLGVAAPDEHALQPVPNQPSQVEISSPPNKNHPNCGEEERDIVESSEQEQDSDNTDNSSDGDGDSVEHRREQDNSEMQQAQVKKSVKWASRCKSKGDDQDGSVHSISNHNSNADESNGSVHSISSHDSNGDESHVEGSSHVLNSNSSLKRGSDSREAMESPNGNSADLTSSSETSNDELVDERSSNISRSNRDADPKDKGYGSNSRQDSD